MSGPRTALVLAGSRGPEDLLARATGVRHKAFIDIAGRPMIAHVIAALQACPGIERIVVAIEDASLLAGLPVTALAAAGSPAATVLKALEELAAELPLLVTTADHPLLTAAMVEHFLRQSPPTADVCAAIATQATIETAYPATRRTYLRFRDRAFSGCNLFLFRTARARGVAQLWREVERHRKRPWRMIALLGPGTLVAFALGRLTLDGALARLSARTGARLAAVELPFAEAAIDVDKPEDLSLVRAILALAGR